MRTGKLHKRSDFGEKTDHPVCYGIQARGVFPADLNVDGHIDLVTSSMGNCVSVLLNDGTGGFLPHVDYDVHYYPQYVVSADLDNDWHFDIATANKQTIDFTILYNSGDGTYGSRLDWQAGDFPMFIHNADFNGDTFIDLVVANGYETPGFVSLAMNNSNSRNFFPAVNVSSCTGPYSVCSGDFNGDGALDMAACGKPVSVHFNMGDGTFEPYDEYVVSNFSHAIVAADFNRDGVMSAEYGGGTHGAPRQSSTLPGVVSSKKY